MKVKFLLSFLIVLGLTISAFGQENKIDVSSVSIVQSSTYTITKDKDNNEVVTLNGKVEIKVENLHIINAEKVVIHKAQKLITVFGNCKYTFTGQVSYSQSSNDPTTRRLEYTIGRNILFIK